jgi:hypothetical protein
MIKIILVLLFACLFAVVVAVSGGAIVAASFHNPLFLLIPVIFLAFMIKFFA